MSLRPGDWAPSFVARASNNPNFVFDSAAGRYIVLFLFGSAAVPAVRHALDDFIAHGAIFDDIQASFFGVSVDPEDERTGRVAERLPGYRYFWDHDMAVSRRYGCIGHGLAGRRRSYVPRTVLLDPGLRVVANVPLADPRTHVAHVLDILAAEPPVPAPAPAVAQAPVLILPRVLEPAMCRALIDLYDRHGSRESGFMREIDGRTVEVRQAQHKLRRDCPVVDAGLRRELRARIVNRILPAVKRAFAYEATYIERYIIGCYDVDNGGHFGPHRDNTTRGTAHRGFAVSLNLDSESYEGCDLRFPEFGRQEYRAPTGGAVVFSCSLLHEVTPIRSGRRHVVLPFLYDEAASRVRAANRTYVEEVKSPSS